MTRIEQDIIVQAIRWWHSKGPAVWSLEDHLSEPAVNTNGEAERALARSVGTYLASQQPGDPPKEKR